MSIDLYVYILRTVRRTYLNISLFFCFVLLFILNVIETVFSSLRFFDLKTNVLLTPEKSLFSPTVSLENIRISERLLYLTPRGPVT